MKKNFFVGFIGAVILFAMSLNTASAMTNKEIENTLREVRLKVFMIKAQVEEKYNPRVIVTRTINGPSEPGTATAGFRFTARNKEARINDLYFHFLNANINELVASVQLFDGTTVVSVKKVPSSVGVVKFTGVNFVIPKDSSRTLLVKIMVFQNGTNLSANDLQIEIGQGSFTGVGFDTTVAPIVILSAAVTPTYVPAHKEVFLYPVSVEFPESLKVIPNANDFEFMRFQVVAQTDIEVYRVRIKISSAGTYEGARDGFYDNVSGKPNYEDFMIWDVATGLIVAGPIDLPDRGNDLEQEIVFTDYFSLRTGQLRTFALTTDIANNTDSSFKDDKLYEMYLGFDARTM
jgi:hypothetical protein